MLVDPGFKEDMYIMAIESKPADPRSFKVTHHFTTNLVEDPEEDPTGLFLNEYALGKNGDIFPPNSGRLIKAGTKINFNLHLNPRGEVTPVAVKLGLKVFPKGQVPKYVAFTQHMGDVPELDIPAGPVSRHDGYFRLQKPALIASFQPHMHNRGKAQCMEAIYPDVRSDSARPGPARIETISCVSNYQFGWHITYPYADDVAPLLPAGTIVHITRGTTTPPTRWNPNPKNWVGGGSRSIDEMGFAWVTITYLEEDDFQQRVARAREQQARHEPAAVDARLGNQRLNAGRASCAPRVCHSSGVWRWVSDAQTRSAWATSRWASAGAGGAPRAGTAASVPPQLPTEITHAVQRRSGVAPYFEGWIKNPDGTFDMVFGYFNRNWVQEFAIPAGPDNKIEPLTGDAGQPTYFLPRRQRCAYRVRVPADFGKKEVVWTITANGRTEKGYGKLMPAQEITERVVMTNGNFNPGDDDPNKPPTLTIAPTCGQGRDAGDADGAASTTDCRSRGRRRRPKPAQPRPRPPASQCSGELVGAVAAARPECQLDAVSRAGQGRARPGGARLRCPVARVRPPPLRASPSLGRTSWWPARPTAQ